MICVMIIDKNSSVNIHEERMDGYIIYIYMCVCVCVCV